MKRSPDRGKHNHTETYLIHFDTNGCLSLPEENKYDSHVTPSLKYVHINLLDLDSSMVKSARLVIWRSEVQILVQVQVYKFILV